MERCSSRPWQPLARWNTGAAFLTPVSNSASMPGLMSIWAISVIMMASSCNEDASLAFLAERRAENAKDRGAGDQKRQQRGAPARRFDGGEQRQSGQRHDGGERQVVARIGVHQPSGGKMPAVAVVDVDRKGRDERHRSGDHDDVECRLLPS